MLTLLSSCKKDYQPKPLGFNRLILPPPVYQLSPDTHWVEVYYPDLKANIHITYYKIKNLDQLKSYLNDAFVLTSKHQIKSYAIDEIIVKTPSGKTAIIAELTGDVPSQFQFTITDSTKNFMRGAVYFYSKVSNDSLAPAIQYMKKDAEHLINTLNWRNE